MSERGNQRNKSEEIPPPDWYEGLKSTWGERLVVDEWQPDERAFDEPSTAYRAANGWKGRDLMHDRYSAVRIMDYHVQYGSGDSAAGLASGGAGTTLTALVHFTRWAESHPGHVHGGAFTSVIDDVVGWAAFVVTGKCRPWSGYTVQITTSLQKTIPVDSALVVRGQVAKLERRKVHVEATLFNPHGENGKEIKHATAQGLVILNRGVLPQT